MLKRIATKAVATFIAASLVFGTVPANSLAKDTDERIIWSYLYMGPNHTQEQALENFKTQVLATSGTVDIASPNWFYVKDQEGNVNDRANKEFVKWAHKQDLKVVPMVNKDYSADYIKHLLKREDRRANLINNLMAFVDEYDLDGLNIDFEGYGLGDEEKETLSLFMEELTERLHAEDKISSIAVMAKYEDNKPSWYSEYDYPRLGQTVDYLIIMAYDQHWATSEPGPVAGYEWVKNRATYGASALDPKKVILGAPLYGRRWIDGAKGSGVSYPNVMEARDIYNFTIKWDDEYKCLTTKYMDEDGKEREIWFENLTSLAYKMHIADDLDLGGAAFWRLGYEDTSWWEEIDAHLQGEINEEVLHDLTTIEEVYGDLDNVDHKPEPEPVITFPDTENHWAKLDVSYLVNRNVVGGFPDGTFKPNENVTRGQLAVMLGRALKLPEDKAPQLFTDVAKDHPMAYYIYATKKAGIIGGYSDGSFKPNAKATRAEVAKMLDIAFKLNGLGGNSFTDVKAGHWAEYHIKSLAAIKITVGYPDGTFKPKANTTRAEIAAFIKRCMEIDKGQITSFDLDNSIY